MMLILEHDILVSYSVRPPWMFHSQQMTIRQDPLRGIPLVFPAA